MAKFKSIIDLKYDAKVSKYVNEGIYDQNKGTIIYNYLYTLVGIMRTVLACQ